MTSDRENVLEGSPEDWGNACIDHYVVFLVDVLGIGDQLLQWNTVDLDSPATCGPIINSVLPVLHFHQMFEKFFANNQKGRTHEVLRKEMPKEEVERFLQCTDYKLGTQWFSDTFIFYARTYNACSDLSTVPVSYFLMACCLAMIDSLATGCPVRGALCVGLGIELGKHNFFGPAFAQAHHLESKCAGYPRILVSPETIAFIEDMKTKEPADAVTERMKRLACHPEKLITKDSDGQLIVDYLGKGIRDFVDEADFKKLQAGVKACYAFAIKEERQLRDEGDEKLERRYSSLRAYMEARLGIWDIEPENVE